MRVDYFVKGSSWLVVLLMVTACAGPIPGPDRDSVPEVGPLAVDGIWIGQQNRVKYRFEYGRAYIHSDFGPRARFGQVIIKSIEQTGPRTYSCSGLVFRGKRVWWTDCEMHLVDAEKLIVVSERMDREDVKFPGSSTVFERVTLDDERWFEAQLTSSRIVARPTETPIE